MLLMKGIEDSQIQMLDILSQPHQADCHLPILMPLQLTGELRKIKKSQYVFKISPVGD